MTVKNNPVKCRAIRHNPDVLNGHAVESITPGDKQKSTRGNPNSGKPKIVIGNRVIHSIHRHCG